MQGTGVDIESLSARLKGVMGREMRISSASPLSGGACQENYRLQFVDGTQKALRVDAKSSLPGSLNRAAEYSVIEAAVAAGVTTPRVEGLLTNYPSAGRNAYLMDWVTGEALARTVLKSKELADARKSLAARLARDLSLIHSIDAGSGLVLQGGYNPDPSRSPVEAALTFARATLDELGEARPAMELIYRWLQEHLPESREVVLVHGDFRTGNFMVTPSGLSAILDWEFAHWGAPEEDVSWLCLRDWRFGNLKKAAGGFATRSEFLREYESASGRVIAPPTLRWWEVMNNLRWAFGSVHQGKRFSSGQSADFELVAIPRRAVEMEWEAIRLIRSSREDANARPA